MKTAHIQVPLPRGPRARTLSTSTGKPHIFRDQGQWWYRWQWGGDLRLDNPATWFCYYQDQREEDAQ